MRNIPLSLVMAASLAFVGCGSPEPDLPPEDSMELPNFFDGNANGLSKADGSTTHITLAKTSVGLVTAAVQLVLAGPAGLFATLLTEKAEKQAEEWVWKRSYPLLGFEGELRASRDGETVNLKALITGKREGIDLDSFVWFTGSHQLGSGQWSLNAPEVTGAVLTIDWQRNSATDKTLVFTNTRVGGNGEGDTITYQLDGTTASMNIVDVEDADGVRTEFRVEWDTEVGSGKMTANATDYCWDTLDNGQVNIPCP